MVVYSTQESGTRKKKGEKVQKWENINNGPKVFSKRYFRVSEPIVDNEIP